MVITKKPIQFLAGEVGHFYILAYEGNHYAYYDIDQEVLRPMVQFEDKTEVFSDSVRAVRIARMSLDLSHSEIDLSISLSYKDWKLFFRDERLRSGKSKDKEVRGLEVKARDWLTELSFDQQAGLLMDRVWVLIEEKNKAFTKAYGRYLLEQVRKDESIRSLHNQICSLQAKETDLLSKVIFSLAQDIPQDVNFAVRRAVEAGAFVPPSSRLGENPGKRINR